MVPRSGGWLSDRAAGRRPTPEALQAFCRERIAGYKIPREVRLVPSLPRNAMGKLMRARLVSAQSSEELPRSRSTESASR